MDYEALMEIIQNTRSIRRFGRTRAGRADRQDHRSRALGSSGFNQQPWEFVVVRDPELRAKITGWYGQYMAQTREMETTREGWMKSWDPEPAGSEADYATAPVYIILLNDTRPGRAAHVDPFNAARLDYIVAASLTNAFLYMHMAASTLGLASQ